MKSFIQRFGEKITGVLSGFDRLVFRGTLRYIAHRGGMMDFLFHKKVLLKDFVPFAQEATETLKEASCKQAKQQGRPIQYLASSQINKEEVALEIGKRDGIREGLIAVLSCVEPCMSYEIHRDRQSRELQLLLRERKCKFLYHYWIDPEFGLMNARIQTWLPFHIQVCLNGREWLARQMDRIGLQYHRRDNCFVWLEDYQKAQQLLENQLKISWASALNRVARMLNPSHSQIFRGIPVPYYWSTYQSEWATDLMFKSSTDLAEIYPQLVLHGITTFSSSDVMRFLGRRVCGAFQGEIVSDFKDRPEGIRIKHRMGGNSIKLYDKQGSVLRVETTINQPRELKVYRRSERNPQGQYKWLRMRKGIADLHRRAQISQAANDRYLDALTSVDTSTALAQLLKQICSPTIFKGKRVRALQPWSQDDWILLETIGRGEFNINGFRNRDLQQLLFPTAATSLKEKRRRSSRISRLLRLLRAHHLIRKIPASYRYTLTPKGREILAAIMSTKNISLAKLHEAAA